MSNQNNSELIRQKYSNFLYEALAAEGKTKAECDTIADRFNALTDTGMDGKNAFSILWESQGNTNGRDMLNRAWRYVHDELDTFNKTAPKINPRKNHLASVIQKFNANIDKCCIEINGKSLTKEEILKLHLPVPANVTEDVLTATASQKMGGVSELVLTIRY